MNGVKVTKLSFKVQGDDKKTMVNPRWKEVETENTECPDCHQVMVVVLGDKEILYGYCQRCNKYFLGE